MPDFSAVLPRLDPYGKIGVHKIIPQVIMLMILERQIICKSFALLSQTLSWHIQHRQEEDKSAEEEIESSSSLKEISSSLASVHSSIEDLKDLEDLEGRSSSSFFPSGLDIPTPPVFSSPSHPSRPTTAPGYYNFITIWMGWGGVGWGGVGLGGFHDFSPTQASIKTSHPQSTIHCGKVWTDHSLPTMFILVMLTFHKMLELGNIFVLVLQNDGTAFSWVNNMSLSHQHFEIFRSISRASILTQLLTTQVNIHFLFYIFEHFICLEQLWAGHRSPMINFVVLFNCL